MSASATARRRLTVLAAVLLLVALTAVATLVGDDDDASGGPLDPAGTAPDGARAVVQVLRGQGVEVEVARSRADLEEQRLDASTTVVVTSTSLLDERAALDLRERARAARLVVVADLLGPSAQLGIATSGPADGARVPAGCRQLGDLRIETGPGVAFPGQPGCFTTGDGPLVAFPEADLVAVGSSALLANDTILDADNAAIALRLLGSRDRLVWYVPSLADLDADAQTSAGVGDLLPDWIGPSLWLLAAAVIAAMLWRGRRFGPLVREPLPVSVRAIEPVEARGRLYRRAGDRAHSAAALREGARRRLAAHLGLGRRHDPRTLVREVARRTGRGELEIAALLDPAGPLPGDDDSLLRLGRELGTLESEVAPR